jgi:pyruvate formate lyase activating enzyme
MQAGFLLEVLDQCRREEIHCAIETSGWASEAVIVQVAEKADLFLYDLKHMDPAKHRSLTGVSNEPILANLKSLAKLGSAIRIRIPIIPGINDDIDNIMATGAFAAALPGSHTVDILPYHGAASAKYHRLGLDYRLSDLVTPSDVRMEQVADTLRTFGLTVKIGG